MIGYDWHSTTERVFVSDEGVINLSLRKIQSVPGSKDQVSIYDCINTL